MHPKTLDQHIDVTSGLSGGKPRVAGHRITVQEVAVLHERLGKGADQIAAEYGLTLAEVHAALAYYFVHREEIDRTIKQGDAFVEELRRGIPSRARQKLDGEDR